MECFKYNAGFNNFLFEEKVNRLNQHSLIKVALVIFYALPKCKHIALNLDIWGILISPYRI